jgi:hypothetical protein
MSTKTQTIAADRIPKQRLSLRALLAAIFAPRPQTSRPQTYRSAGTRPRPQKIISPAVW